VTRGTPSITALRPHGRGRTAVELDGSAWRTFDDACVVAARLAVGQSLTRDRAAVFARARRRQRALVLGLRALEQRDLPIARLDAALARRGVSATDRVDTVASLVDSGLADDRRYARVRARTLAERGRGDLAIADDLRSNGVASDLIEDAVRPLEPEQDRAGRIVSQRGASARTLRYLARRGFTEGTLEALVDAVTDSGDSPRP
jgi:SOS response regulatory protein OraA/RecX